MRLVFQDAVCAPAYKGLTGAQRLFLDVMADDLPGASSVADVASRAGKSRSWANAYRRSLIDASVIERARAGLPTPYLTSASTCNAAATIAGRLA